MLSEVYLGSGGGGGVEDFGDHLFSGGGAKGGINRRHQRIRTDCRKSPVNQQSMRG